MNKASSTFKRKAGQECKHLFSFEFKPDAKLAEFLMQIENVPGAMNEVTAFAARHKVNLLSALVDSPPSAAICSWTFFADFTNADIDASAMRDELRKLNLVRQADFKTTEDGFIVDSFNFPALYGANRGIAMSATVFQSITKRLRSLFGFDSPTSKVVLHQIGEAAGRDMFEFTLNLIGFDLIKKDIQRNFDLWANAGWGRFEVEKADYAERTATVKVWDGIECNAIKGANFQSHFIRGMVSGWFSAFFDYKVEAEETKCISKEDPKCVFVIHRPKT